MRRGSLAEERPDLVGQWSARNTLSPNKVSCGSHLKVWWVCDNGHEWESIVKNRALLGSGCPYCEHRAILKGYNDLATLKPELDNTDNDTQKNEEDGYFTETLARIYIKQGNYSRALEIIRQLSLHNPKKNTYFADQIRFLEKLIINSNKK